MHSLIWKYGFDLDKYVGNTLVMMYGNCGEIELARKVFDGMPVKDVVSWSSLISGYVNCSYSLDALKTLQQMKSANEDPNSITLVSLLSACTNLLNISIGESIHSYIIVNNIELNTPLGTALLELYSKCGDLERAFYVFNSLKEKNLKSWTVMISGFADHGQGEDALFLYKKMVKTGLKPDSIVFSKILSACSHMGLVEEGKRYFENMVSIYNVKPTIEHFGCLIDMLGRAGMTKEAYQVIKNMLIEPNSIIIRSFISACMNHGYVVYLDEKLRNRLLEIEPDLGANYVVAASVSLLSDNWNEAVGMRVAMKGRGLKKSPGCSWIETNGDLATQLGI